MKSTELAELLLMKLYDLAEAHGHRNYFSLEEIATELGEKDMAKIREVARYLKGEELINAVFTTGGSSGSVTGAGSILVEQGGKTGIIKKYRESRNQLPMSDPSTRVFVVHGHSEEMKQTVARTLEKLGLEPIILHEKPNKGRTVIEKFIDYSDVGFAVVLMSGDDCAFPKGQSANEFRTRARQNVIMELGFFLGRLGRERVAAIYQNEDLFELPSDYNGVLYIPYDTNGQWRYQLTTELRAAGYKEADKNKL